MDRLICLADVERATSLKKSKIYDMMKNREFPRSVAVTSRRRAWLESSVRSFIEERVRQSMAKAVQSKPGNGRDCCKAGTTDSGETR